MMSRSVLLVSLASVALAGCEDAPRHVRSADASAPTPSSTPLPLREGCVRSGRLEVIETDASCVVRAASEDAMRTSLRSLSISLDPVLSEVIPGGTSLLVLTIKNVATEEVTVYFEARTRPSGPKTDWSRVSGIPEPRVGPSDTPRLFFPMVTTDSRDRDVDALPTVAGSAAPPSSATVLAVHLRPSAKLTRNISWWALRIPAPAPVVHDDAGHRYVPKTSAIHLTAGEYSVTVDVPFYGLAREERRVTTRVRVSKPPLLDGGFPRRY